MNYPSIETLHFDDCRAAVRWPLRIAHLFLIAAATMLLALSDAWAQKKLPDFRPSGAEQQFRQVFVTLARRGLDAALEEADRLVAQYPNFRLAHLLRGDLLLARAHRISGLGNGAIAAREKIDELRAEALARLRAARDLPPPDRVPRYLLQLATSQKYAIVVDASRSRMYLFENATGAPRLVGHYYTSLGKRGTDKEREGDQRTPIGVYDITTKIPGRKLPDLYGWGAFPLNYPNAWDRLRGRTGHGIWIHGVPSDTYARAPWTSDGCIALANPEIEQIAHRIKPGTTQVVVARKIQWVTSKAWLAERDGFLRAVHAWRKDWESRDTGRYLAHYARKFRSDGMNLSRWRAHKRRVNSGKSWIKVSLSNLSVLRDPGGEPLMVVTFNQDYRSSNFAQKSRKRQYWVVESGEWKIAYESVVGRPVLALPASYPGERERR